MISRRILLLGFLIQALILINSCDEKSTEPSQPVLSVSHLTVDFGTDQLGLQFYINNGGGSTLEWRIEDTPQNWYRCSPTDGSTVAETDTVEIMVDRVGLTGEFTDTLSISSNGGTAQVEILMEVPTLPTLSVYPANLDFGAVDDSASFRILNSGPGRLEWSISENLDWLELSPDSGSTAGETDTIIVTVQRPNLSNDILNGDIMISSNGGSHTVGVSVHDTVYTAAGIFASLIVERRITRHHMGYSRQDLIAARFDNSHSHCEPVDPLAADSVHCNEYTLIWNDENGDFVYEQTMPRTFLTL